MQINGEKEKGGKGRKVSMKERMTKREEERMKTREKKRKGERENEGKRER